MVLDHLEHLNGFEPQFAAMLLAAQQRRPRAGDESADDLRRKLSENASRQNNTGKGIAESGGSPVLYTILNELTTEQRLLQAKLEQALEAEQQPVDLPTTLQEMIHEIRSQLNQDIDSYELGDELRAMTRSLYIYAVRLLDGDRPHMRTRMTLDLSALWKGLQNSLEAAQMLVIMRDFPLFDPPQRVQILPQIVELRASGMTERSAATTLGITVAAAQRAMKLHRMMVAAGQDTPYVLVTSPDELSAKCRRHRHRKYHFHPVDGYVPPEL